MNLNVALQILYCFTMLYTSFKLYIRLQAPNNIEDSLITHTHTHIHTHTHAYIYIFATS